MGVLLLLIKRTVNLYVKWLRQSMCVHLNIQSLYYRVRACEGVNGTGDLLNTVCVCVGTDNAPCALRSPTKSILDSPYINTYIETYTDTQLGA